MNGTNILLITTDQQRFDTIAALGNKNINTPHLNWLVDRGITFTRTYTDAPVCIPARATIMNGQYGYTNDFTLNYGRPSPINSSLSLPGILTAAGMQTRAQGKMHFNPNRKNYGFEHMEILEDYYRQIEKYPEAGVPSNHGLGQNEMEVAISTVDETHSLTHWIVDRSIDFLETRDESRPFFLWTSFSKPHPPFDPCLNYWLLYQNTEVPPPIYGDWSENPEKICPGYIESSRYLGFAERLTQKQLADAKRAYYACITQIDYNLGILFARMRELNILDNTTIIFTSDHGEMLGDHHLAAKQVFFEGSAHIPMIILPAKGLIDESLRGTKCESIASLADILPTCLDAVDIKAPKNLKIDGISLFSQLRGKKIRNLFFGSCGHLHCTIENNYKFLWTGMGGGELLFDLKNDPYEQSNLSHNKSYNTILERMRKLLIEHLKNTKQKGVKNSKLSPYLKSLSINEIRPNCWPGFHSRKRPNEVMH
ncbi:MAG TPA: sulfatase-like hydrolase/transferase [Victivallales bacterium]|nr:sulfatase-like hydrolase/transferase [Victivallales bacterium]